jgi:hypothetical protein
MWILSLSYNGRASGLRPNWNIGSLEYWNDGLQKNPEMIFPPIDPLFHRSNIPLFQLI